MYHNFVRSIADHNTDTVDDTPNLGCNPMPLTPAGGNFQPYNCCASVESAALPQLAYGCSGWNFGEGKTGLAGSLPSVVPETRFALGGCTGPPGPATQSGRSRVASSPGRRISTSGASTG